MRLTRWIPRGLLLRRTLRALEAIVDQQTRQTLLFEQVAAHLLPKAPAAADARAIAETGVSYHDPLEAAIVEGYAEKVQRDLGRAPSEEEILSYLADEKTMSLHARLKEREALLRDRQQERA